MGKIAAIQMCSSDNVRNNLRTAGRLIAEAAANGAALVALPEMFAMMGHKTADQQTVSEASGHGPIQDYLKQFATEHKIWIVGGTIPVKAEGSHKINSACFVYNDEGEQVARYDKIHMFDVNLPNRETYQESAVIQSGDHLAVVATPVGKIGLAVCYDVRFAALFAALAQQGAEIFVVPTAFTKTTGMAHWEVLTRARAIENLCYFVGACQGGTHVNGRQTYGHALIVEPWGAITSEVTQDGNAIVYGDIDLVRLHKLRESLPVLKHQQQYQDCYRACEKV